MSQGKPDVGSHYEQTCERERKLTNLLQRIVLQPFPSLSTVSAKDVRESGIEFDLVFVKVLV